MTATRKSRRTNTPARRLPAGVAVERAWADGSMTLVACGMRFGVAPDRAGYMTTDVAATPPGVVLWMDDFRRAGELVEAGAIVAVDGTHYRLA